MTLLTSNISQNKAEAGKGGDGAFGAIGGGNGGNGLTAFGGGISVLAGSVSLTTCTLADNQVVGQQGGTGGAANTTINIPGGGGNGGSVKSAGIYIQQPAVVSLVGTSVNGSSTPGTPGNGGNGFSHGIGGSPGTASLGPIDGLLSPSQRQMLISTQPPSSVTANSPFGMVIQVLDASGNLDTTFNGSVTISLVTNPHADKLKGTLKVKAFNGFATFSGLTLSKSGLGDRIKASAAGTVSTLTNLFGVT